MTQASTRQRPVPDTATGPRRRLGAVALPASGAAAAVVLALVHLAQGTSTVDAHDLLALVTGEGEELTWDVLVASRVPRLSAGVVVGFALGVAGAAFQSLARNPLASPDTLAVNAGAHLAVVAAAALGISLPTLPIGGLAFVGGLLAAGLVFALSSGGASGPTRLILAGTATALALTSVTTVLLILHEQATIGLFAWGQGSLLQANLDAVVQMAPVVVVATALLLLTSHRLDILALGDDTASVLGVRVRRTRVQVTVLAVLLAAAAVTIAGPVGFVGLCAPVIVRLLSTRVQVLRRHRVLLPAAGVAGVLIVLAADVLVRALLGAQSGVDLPIGVVTTLAGAAVLIWLARGRRDSGPTGQPSAPRLGRARSRRAFAVKATALATALAVAVTAGMLLGDTWVLTGDIADWVRGRTGPALTFVLDARLPRVVGAVLAGAALAVAGTVVQAVCRNPLAEPGLLGITAGAGLGAVSLITFVPAAGVLALSSVAGVGALVTFGVVYALAWRGGLSSDRLVLIGIGMWFGCMALTTAIIVLSDPWNTSKALTWLSGSTYGRTLPQVVPVAVAVALVAPFLALGRRQLDLLSIDDDTPLVLGVRLERTRLLALGGAALLTSTAVSAIGVVGFVGLVAPHAARALVGGQSIRVLPVAALLGALLVSLADTIGRTAIAPAQLPAGLLAALIGTPYFVWLLWRSRA